MSSVKVVRRLAWIEPLESRLVLAATTGLMPINDLGTGLYLNQYQGGLYPGGSNVVPTDHASVGSSRGKAIVPRNAAGNVDSVNGKYVFLSIGMSNTTQEFSTVISTANANSQVNKSKLVLVDGAAGGQTASTWDQTTDANYDRIKNNVLAPRGLSEAQVQACWVKVANAGPTSKLPSTSADAFTLLKQMGDITRTLKKRYPNLQQIFFASRIYAGWATTNLNPEPYAYESGFAVKWLIQAQINQAKTGQIDARAGDLSFNDGDAPWIAWGPYLWADGTKPRSDGLTWQQSDFQSDGTHPSTTGRQKVANRLLSFLLSSPFSTPWFKATASSTKPLAPTNLQVRAISPTRIDLRWVDNATNELRYIVERALAGNPTFSVIFRGNAANQTQYSDLTVQPGKTYYYRVRAEGPNGVTSDPSNIAHATTPTQTTTQQSVTTSTQPKLSSILPEVLTRQSDPLQDLFSSTRIS